MPGIIYKAIKDAGIPIDWVECPTLDSFILHFKEGVTPEQEAEAEAIAQSLLDPVTQAKISKVKELSDACSNAIRSGFQSSALGEPHHYSSELEDQLNLLGATLLGVDLDYVCSNAEGLKIARSHTSAQMQQVYGDGAMTKQILIYQFHQLRQQVEAAESVEAVGTISW